MERNLLGIGDLSDTQIEAIYHGAETFLQGQRWGQPLEKKTVCLAFFQPSTRTRVGFERATGELGGRHVGFSDVAQSRSVYPYSESFTDALRVLSELADLLVVRCSESLAALDLREVRVPIVNAGDGSNEHPTQALSDAWCIYSRAPHIRNTTIGLVGDPRARVFRSFVLLLLRLGARVFLSFSHDGAKLPADVVQAIHQHGGTYAAMDQLSELVRHSDFIEILPYQLPAPGQTPLQPQPSLQITRSLVLEHNPGVFLMHPGPRNWELAPDTDDMSQSLFFFQVRVALAVKMAVLTLLLGDERK